MSLQQARLPGAGLVLAIVTLQAIRAACPHAPGRV